MAPPRMKTTLWLKAGAKVEVSSGEVGFVGSWYAAKILHHRKRQFTIQYETLVTDKGRPVVEQALRKHLRPVPPVLEGAKWAVGDAVEAYDNDGWWMGVVCELLAYRDRVVVYFESTLEKKVFPAAQIRCRQDWLHGKWVIMSQGSRDNAEEGITLNSKEQVASEKLLCQKATDAEQPQATGLRGPPEHSTSQMYMANPAVRACSQPEQINNITHKPMDDDSMLITESTRNISQTRRKQPSTFSACPCGSESTDDNRDSLSLQKRKKGKISLSPMQEQCIGGVCEPEILSTDPIICLDADKRLCLLESQSERLSKGTQSPPLGQTNKMSSDQFNNVSCSPARERGEQFQKVEKKHYENRARLAIAKSRGIMATGKVHASHFCCSCATANDPEPESLSGLCGATAECASTLTTQNLELKAYAAVLHAFYSKGPITWQQELLITDLRRHLNISGEEHLLQLLRIMSHS